MNYARILKVTNWLLVLIGYHVHHFEHKSRRFRLSLWLIANFAVITLFYFMAFTHHFEHSALLQLMQSISPFLKRLIRLQLLMGLKIYLFGIYEFRAVTRVANELASILPKTFAQKFTKGEAFAYFLNFSTLLIAFCICLYIGVEMKFELPPLDNILVFCGLLIPHFILGGALKMYNVGVWLLREQILDLSQEFENVTSTATESREQQAKDSLSLECGQKSSVEIQDLSAPLEVLHHQLHQITKAEKMFNAILQRQLALLVILNSNCLLAGTYSRVYYETSWNVILMQRTKNVFQATNCGIFILILWDYFTLGLTHLLYEQVKTRFTKNVYAVTKQRQRFTEETRFKLNDLYDALRNDVGSKLPGSLKINFCTFLLLQVFIALTIALIVVYHYLNDQIMALNERFDGLNDDDDDE